MSPAQRNELLDDRRIRLPGATVGAAGILMKGALAVLLVPVDPLMGYLR